MQILIDYNQLQEILNLGAVLNKKQQLNFYLGLTAMYICNQPNPQFFEINIILMLAVIMRRICPIKVEISVAKILHKSYTNFLFLYLILFSKPIQNNKIIHVIKLLISYFLINKPVGFELVHDVLDLKSEFTCITNFDFDFD